MFWGTIGSSGYLSDWRVGIRVWSCCSHFGGGYPERGFYKKISHGCSWELNSLWSTLWFCFWGSGFLSSFWQLIPNLLLEFPDDVSTGVETVGQPRVRRNVVIRRLVWLVASCSLTSLKLSTVGVEVGR